MAIQIKEIKKESFMYGLLQASAQVTAAKRAAALKKMQDNATVPIPRDIAGCKKCTERLARGPESSIFPPAILDEFKLL